MIDLIHKFPFEGRWVSLSETELCAKSPDNQQAIRDHIEEYSKNRLKWFLPHGDGLKFLNDHTNGIVMLVAPTRSGKSCHGTAWLAFRSIPCDPSWPCFTEHGIKFIPFRGPRKQVISSYSWDNVTEVWGEYQKWLPRDELGPYALDWGRYPGEKGKPIVLNFGDGKPKKARLRCGTEFVFLCDGQSQAHWEGKRFDDHHCDEQREREKFIGYLRGTSNTQGLVQVCMTLTGHVLPERPDTGAGGFIKRELWDGTYTFGKTVGRYQISMKDVPDAVLSGERKAELYQQWVAEPERNQDLHTLRKGVARYWGGWEPGSGLVLDNWDPHYILIPPYDRSHRLCLDSTKYRGLDHGNQRPMAAVWVEVFPWGDAVLYREYYVAGKTVPPHAAAIVEASGNKRVKQKDAYDEESETYFPVYEEVFENERYMASVMDSRSFASKAAERQTTLGRLYNDYGLACSPAKGTQNRQAIPRIKSFVEVDPERVHIMHQFWKRKVISDAVYQKWLAGRKTGYKGGCRLYVVDTCRFTQSEAAAWSWKVQGEEPMSKDDHIVGAALKYVLMEEPTYYGDIFGDVPVADDGVDDEVVPGRGYKFVGG